jgi:hypothetical protein
MPDSSNNDIYQKLGRIEGQLSEMPATVAATVLPLLSASQDKMFAAMTTAMKDCRTDQESKITELRKTQSEQGVNVLTLKHWLVILAIAAAGGAVTNDAGNIWKGLLGLIAKL